MSSTSGPDITNIIVVMLENRSYDNVLGWLYNSNNQPPYNQAPTGQANLNGLTGNETNPPIQKGGNPIAVLNQTTTTDGKTGKVYPGTTVPIYDPGELFKDMAQQILGGTSIPSKNPYTDPWPPNSDSLMQGFTLNYAQITEPLTLQMVPSTNYQDVMNYLTPAQVPVTAWLANNFAVCDQWFASVPTQTFTNRAFANCAAPAVSDGNKFSLIDDAQYVTDRIATLPSVFSQLDAAFPDSASGSPPNWKVYFHDYSITTMISPYVYSKGKSKDNVNLATYDDSDWGPNPDPLPMAHPKTGVHPLGTRLGALPTTFLEDGFNFNVYGGRVPAIIVSPFIGAGTTITPPTGFPPFDHASILKTVWDCFNIPDSLTYRDAVAPSLYQSLSSTADNKTGLCNVTLSCDSALPQT